MISGLGFLSAHIVTAAIGIALVFAAIWMLIGDERKIYARKLAAIGEHYGYTWDNAYERLVCRSGGRAIHLFEEALTRPNQSQAGIEMRLTGETAFHFSLTPETCVTKMANFIGRREIKIGDSFFDREWFIETNDPEFFVALMTDDIRRQLAAERSLGRNSRYQAGPGYVRYFLPGSLSHPEMIPLLEGQRGLLAAIADTLDVYDATESGR